MGSLLFLRIIHQRTSLDVLWQSVEYDQLRCHHEYDERECDESCQGVLRVSELLCIQYAINLLSEGNQLNRGILHTVVVTWLCPSEVDWQSDDLCKYAPVKH